MKAKYFSARYAKRIRSDDIEWSDDISRPHSIEVCDHEAVETGLLDSEGYPIMRAPNRIGFQFDEDVQ